MATVIGAIALSIAGLFAVHWYLPIYHGRRQVEAALELVTGSMKDPGSAQFRNTRVHGSLVCGEVNAKNLYGAYVGFRAFYTTGWPPAHVWVDPDDRAVLAAEICRVASARFPAGGNR